MFGVTNVTTGNNKCISSSTCRNRLTTVRKFSRISCDPLAEAATVVYITDKRMRYIYIYRYTVREILYSTSRSLQFCENFAKINDIIFAKFREITKMLFRRQPSWHRLQRQKWSAPTLTSDTKIVLLSCEKKLIIINILFWIYLSTWIELNACLIQDQGFSFLLS